MSPNAQMKLLNLYKGKSIRKASHALDVATAYHAQKTLQLRLRISGLTIGD
jgi:hypothetical protein